MSPHGSDQPVNTDRTRHEFLKFFVNEPTDTPAYSDGRRRAAYLEIPKLEWERLGHSPPPVVEDNIHTSVDSINDRDGASDFVLPALLHLLYRYPDSNLLSSELREEIKEAVQHYRYWFDEPGEHSGFYSTENHQILYHACEYLAGQLLPNRTFTNNGRTGEWHRRHAEEHLDRWLEWRARFGFSEWQSNTYYGEDLAGLAVLAEHADNESIQARSRDMIDLMLFEIALNSFEATFGSSHGRTNSSTVVNPYAEEIGPITYLFWGEGSYDHLLSRAAMILVGSDYRVPSVVQHAALDDSGEMENRERHSLDVEDAVEHGLDPKDPDDLMFFWGASVGRHRDVIDTSLDVCSTSYYQRYRIFERARRYHLEYADHDDYEPNPVGTALTEANLYTFRTSDYMLSCAQDFRAGRPGWQQHIWQATLPDRAIVFTTHPGTESLDGRPNHWHGNAVHPRAAAYKNVLVSIHDFDPGGHSDTLSVLTEDLSSPKRPDFTEVLTYTHGFFPQYAFDEWTERGRWVCGRKDDSYVGLYSHVPAEWAEPYEEMVEDLRPRDAEESWHPGPYELRAEGTENVWICELGRQETHGSFDEFVEGVATASVKGDTDAVSYESPSRGTVEFGWDRAFEVDGESISLDDYPRFDNPYCRAQFDETRYDLSNGSDSHTLDFER